MRGILVFYLGVLLPFLCISQIQSNDTTRIAPITYDIQGSYVTYGAEMPPLNQIAGAPKAYYTYYWEFGDGSYSFKKNPTHRYKKTGTKRTSCISILKNFRLDN